MTDIEKLKYIVKNGTCYVEYCNHCPMKCMENLDNISIDIVKEAKKLLNELRIKKLKRLL